MTGTHIRQLIEELQRDLGAQGSLASLVTRATRIAHLLDQPEYAALFELHLDGFDPSETAGARVTRWSDQSRHPRWNPVQAFFQDRATSTGQCQAHALARLEEFYDDARRLLTSAPNKASYGTELQRTVHELNAIFVRIRNRIMVFANSTEQSLRSPMASEPPPPGNITPSVFIGHGASHTWRELQSFLEKRLRLPVVEFNRAPSAGISTTERLAQMLSDSHFAFLVLTAEDPRGDGSMHARENVVHEAGLFQGRLGFRKAIILLEDGCEEFSNIQGLGQIRFRRGKIAGAFDEVRRVLQREGIVPQD